jgi:predicted enzyme related to lactoylglutathione lyase
MFEKVAFTMYPVSDVARARAFYEETLGLTVGPVHGDGERAWIEYDLPGGGCLAISNMTGQEPGPGGGTVALEVDDREALLERLQAAGVTVTAEHIPSPVCDMSIVADPDGNSLILHQLKNT